MILQLDITQMLLAMFFWGPIISLIFFYVGRYNVQTDEQQLKNKINRLETRIEELHGEKAELLTQINEDDSP